MVDLGVRMPSSGVIFKGLTAANWTLASTATVLTVGRYVIRFRVRRRFYYDDLAHLLAWGFMLGSSVVIQLDLSTLQIVQVESIQSDTPADVPRKLWVTYLRHQVIVRMFLILSLWLVKLAFMFLFRMLFWTSSMFRRLWWVVIGVLATTIWMPIIGNFVSCGGVSKKYDFEACNSNYNAQGILLIFVCIVHVGTDVLVMALPIYMIRKLQMTWVKKISLTAVFGVILISIAFDILRTAQSLNPRTGLYAPLYYILETSLTVIASCLPTYKALLRTRPTTTAFRQPEIGLIQGDTAQQLLANMKPLDIDSNMGHKSNPGSSLTTHSKVGGPEAFWDDRDSGPEDLKQDIPHVLQKLAPVHPKSISQVHMRVDSLA